MDFSHYLIDKLAAYQLLYVPVKNSKNIKNMKNVFFLDKQSRPIANAYRASLLS